MRSNTQGSSVRRAGSLLASLAFASVVAPGTSSASELRDAGLVGGRSGDVRLKQDVGFPNGFPYSVRAMRRGSCL
jgi:hypothetical protein